MLVGRRATQGLSRPHLRALTTRKQWGEKPWPVVPLLPVGGVVEWGTPSSYRIVAEMQEAPNLPDDN